MKNLGKVTDKDFGLDVKHNSEAPSVRYGARGIVVNNDEQIAVFFKSLKNEYKLPGGGIENYEDAALAFQRECKEEVGVEVDIIQKLGTITEEKSQENFMQISNVFLAKKTRDLGELSLTQKEMDEGAKILWMPPKVALDKMNECLSKLKESKYDSVYRTQFMVKRDIKILDYYINNIDVKEHK